MKNIKLIIPAWGSLNNELQLETGLMYAAFISLGGEPLYKHIIRQYMDDRNLFPHARIILSLDAPQIVVGDDALFCIDVIRLEHSDSIAATILAALQGVEAGEPVVVNMADTLARFGEEVKLDTIYTYDCNDLYRWTSVVINSSGGVDFPHDRDDADYHHDSEKVCVGIFSFSDGALLKKELKEALETPTSNKDPFFTAILNYSKNNRMELRNVEEWYDFGHIDTFYESRLSHQNLRHFNNLCYDPLNGQVTKTSSKLDSFRHQVRWFKQVPDSLLPFLPRVFESNDGNKPFITMELLSIPTLSELFVSERLASGAWNGVVRTIAHILEELGRYPFQTEIAPELARYVYIEKTKSRLSEFINQDPLALNYKVSLSSGEFGLSTVLDTLERYVTETGLLDIDTLSPIHGDFCFSNLLYDLRLRLVKMIDPRGEFGVPGIYGDSRYDLAKLAHSFGGGYDFIVTDRFSVELNEDASISLSINRSEYHMQVRSIFENILFSDFSLFQQVEAIQALLFLSMLPLHKDKPRRQLAMLATGLSMYGRIWQSKE